MNILISFLIIIPAIWWAFNIRKTKNDLLCPQNILTIIYLVRVIIPVLCYANSNLAEEISNLNIKEAVESNNLLIFTVLSTLGYFLTILGLNLRYDINKKRKTNNNNIKHKDNARTAYRIIGIIIWTIGLISCIILVQKSGGINYYLNNIQKRTILLGKNDLLSTLIPFLTYGCILIAYSRKNKKMTLIFLLFAITTGIIQGMGARRPSIILILEIIFIYHYTIAKIDFKKILNFKFLIIALLLYISFTTIVTFRTNGAYESFRDNPVSYISSSTNSIPKTVTKESYVSHQTFLIKYFNENNNYWYGGSFLGLITAFVPSSLYPNKPPVDDGTYLYSISLGRDNIRPPMSFKELNSSSYPLETLGSMYANFGIIGVIIGFVIKGVIIGYFYRKLRQKQESIFMVFIYVTCVFNFELATLNIVQVVASVIIFGTIYIVAKKFQPIMDTRSKGYGKQKIA